MYQLGKTSCEHWKQSTYLPASLVYPSTQTRGSEAHAAGHAVQGSDTTIIQSLGITHSPGQKKKDGSVRFCIDYWKVNAVTRRDVYPLPRMDDTLDNLAGAKWFSTLGMVSGYWQVEVADEDKEKTAFCTPDGLYEFNVLPFGLCNGPAMFQ